MPIQRDSSGNLYTMLLDNSGSVRFYKFNGSSWSLHATLSETEGVRASEDLNVPELWSRYDFKITGSGNIHVAAGGSDKDYYPSDSSAPNFIDYAFYDASNTTWTTSRVVSRTGGGFRYIRISVDNAGKAYITYYQDAAPNFHITSNASGSWTDVFFVSDGSAYASFAGLTDNSGNVYFFSQGASGSSRMVTNKSGSWQATQLSTLSGMGSLDFNDAVAYNGVTGEIVLSWSNSAYDEYYRSASSDGGVTWTTELVIAASGAKLPFSSGMVSAITPSVADIWVPTGSFIAFGADGTEYHFIVEFDSAQSSGVSRILTRNTNGTWIDGKTTITELNTVGFGSLPLPSAATYVAGMGVDSDGEIHIVYGNFLASNATATGANAAQYFYGVPSVFQVLPTATTPTVITGSATSISATGATLNGMVNDNAASTTVTFEFGTTTGYGSTATATQSPLGAGAGNTSVSKAVTGLTCNTTYHFRTKGVNSAGTTTGNDATFSTSACPVTYTVTYDGNGNTGGSAPTDGSSPYNSGSTVTVLGNTGSLTRTGYTFAGWNSAANGSGTDRAASSTFSIGANTTLYAKWTGSVSYNSNGATSGTAPTDGSAYLPGATVTAASNSGSLAKTGYTFAGWNTAADGSGTTYTAGQWHPQHERQHHPLRQMDGNRYLRRQRPQRRDGSHRRYRLHP